MLPTSVERPKLLKGAQALLVSGGGIAKRIDTQEWLNRRRHSGYQSGESACVPKDAQAPAFPKRRQPRHSQRGRSTSVSKGAKAPAFPNGRRPLRSQTGRGPEVAKCAKAPVFRGPSPSPPKRAEELAFARRRKPRCSEGAVARSSPNGRGTRRAQAGGSCKHPKTGKRLVVRNGVEAQGIPKGAEAPPLAKGRRAWSAQRYTCPTVP